MLINCRKICLIQFGIHNFFPYFTTNIGNGNEIGFFIRILMLNKTVTSYEYKEEKKKIKI